MATRSAKGAKASATSKPAAQAAGSQSQGGSAGSAAPAGGPEQEPAAALEPSSVSTDGSGETVGAQAPAVSDDTPRASQDAPSIPPAAADPAAGAGGEPRIITTPNPAGRPPRRGGVGWAGTFSTQLVAADQAQRVWTDPHLDFEARD